MAGLEEVRPTLIWQEYYDDEAEEEVENAKQRGEETKIDEEKADDVTGEQMKEGWRDEEMDEKDINWEELKEEATKKKEQNEKDERTAQNTADAGNREVPRNEATSVSECATKAAPGSGLTSASPSHTGQQVCFAPSCVSRETGVTKQPMSVTNILQLSGISRSATDIVLSPGAINVEDVPSILMMPSDVQLNVLQPEHVFSAFNHEQLRKTAVDQAMEMTECDVARLNTNRQLARLKFIFYAAKLDGHRGLSMEQFSHAMRYSLDKEVTDEELSLLFMKMDAKCDGLVDWEEYITYYLLEYKARARMIDEARLQPFPHELREYRSHHFDQIVRILHIPLWAQRKAKLDQHTGRYALLSLDGILSFRTLEMEFQQTHNLAPYSSGMVSALFLDMTYIYTANLLCVASTDRDIGFFDISSHVHVGTLRCRQNCIRRYFIAGLEASATTLHNWSDIQNRKQIILLWGDMSGNIFSLVFDTTKGADLFATRTVFKEHKDTNKIIKFIDIQRGVFPTIKLYKLSKVHDSWVLRVMYIPDLDIFFSCSHSQVRSLYAGDIQGRFHRDYFAVSRGIPCLEYSPCFNALATGGMDHCLRLWNPYVPNKATAVLKGFSRPVVQVGFHDKKGLVIGMDKSNMMLVFDLSDYACLQQIHGRLIKLGMFPVSAIYFNENLEHLLLATSQLAVLPTCDRETIKIEVAAHRKPIVAALYNKTFNMIVSGCKLSVINVWDFETGEKLIEHINTHSYTCDGKIVPVSITYMTFDNTERRLLTGAGNGSVRIWNFNVGLLLKDIDVVDHHVVTGIVSCKGYIYVAGWGRRVVSYPDTVSNQEQRPRPWPRKHKEDIHSMALIYPSFIVTGSYDGDIIISYRETGLVCAKMNAYRGIRVHDDVLFEQFETPKIPAVSPRTEEPATSESSALSAECGPEIRQRGTCTHPLLHVFSPGDNWEPPKSTDASKRRWTGMQYENIARKFEAAVEHIVVLQARVDNIFEPHTAILITGGSEGWCRAWSATGGLLGQFNVNVLGGESVTSMTVSADNEFLITCDSIGYCRMWDIANYCVVTKMSEEQIQARQRLLKYMFPYLSVDQQRRGIVEMVRRARELMKRPPPQNSLPAQTLVMPFLLTSFRAHAERINHVEYVDHRRLLITASNNCIIRLWTLSGRFVGSFGRQWNELPTSMNPVEPTEHIPKDIRRTASPVTQRLIKCDVKEYWELVNNYVKTVKEKGKAPFKNNGYFSGKDDLEELIAKYWIPKVKKEVEEDFSELPPIENASAVTPKSKLIDIGLCDATGTSSQSPEKREAKSLKRIIQEKILNKKEFPRLKSLLDKADKAKTARNREAEHAVEDGEGKAITAEKEDSEMTMEQLMAQIGRFKEGSAILGKAWKRKQHHKEPPKLPPIIHNSFGVAVFHAIDCHELEPVEDLTTPPIVTELLGSRSDTLSKEREKGRRGKGRRRGARVKLAGGESSFKDVHSGDRVSSSASLMAGDPQRRLSSSTRIPFRKDSSAK